MNKGSRLPIIIMSLIIVALIGALLFVLLTGTTLVEKKTTSEDSKKTNEVAVVPPEEPEEPEEKVYKESDLVGVYKVETEEDTEKDDDEEEIDNDDIEVNNEIEDEDEDDEKEVKNTTKDRKDDEDDDEEEVTITLELLENGMFHSTYADRAEVGYIGFYYVEDNKLVLNTMYHHGSDAGLYLSVNTFKFDIDEDGNISGRDFMTKEEEKITFSKTDEDKDYSLKKRQDDIITLMKNAITEDMMDIMD